MSEPHSALNAMTEEAARAALSCCCGSTRWVLQMLRQRPFASTASMQQAAHDIWSTLERADYLEAFAHHPQIGADLDSLREKFGAPRAQSLSLASAEQSGVGSASEPVLLALQAENQAYLQRFGYIFIVCATGKTADEMLALLRARRHNDAQLELSLAATEQSKITALRLGKLSTTRLSP